MAENETPETTEEVEHPLQKYVAPTKEGLSDEDVRKFGISAIDYEPHFDRLGTVRRVLGHITDEDHVGRGPRNTAERLHQELVEDPYTNYRETEDVSVPLKKLVAAGLVEQREDGTYKVTEAGITELVN